MINASKEFKEKLKNGANIVNYADITLSDGTVLNLTYKDFMIGGCTIEDKTTDGKFGVGFCIGKTLTIRLENDDERFSKYDFYNSIINLYVALLLDDGTIEKIRKGIYYAMVPQTPGDVIEVSAVDGMYKLDKDYSSSSTIYPATLQKILTDACLGCGIPIGFRQFDNMSYIVKEKPEKATYRQVVSWACQIAGYNARIDNNGYMQLVWYNFDILSRNYDGGDFKVYPHGTILDGGSFKDYTANTIISGGLFTDEMPEHIFQIKELSVHTDDVRITGVKVVSGEDASELFGENEYVIELKDNPFAAGNEREIAEYLGRRIVGMIFRPFSAQVLNNPLYEPFDVVRVSDRKGNSYNSLINSVSYTVGAYTQISCEAEDPLRNGSAYFSEAAAAVVEARRNSEKQLTEYDKAVQSMNQLAMNAMGFHTTYEDQPDGSRIVYLHDKSTLAESTTIYKQTIDGFFISTDGGKSYTAGFDKNGNVVVNILYAIGIVADWIRSGRLEVKKDNKTTFLADCDTGEVRIVADYFSLSSGQTIDSIAQEKANVALTVAEGKINAEITRATGAEGTLSTKITANAEGLAAEITRASSAEGTLSTRITATENGLISKVSKGDLSSEISQEAGKISLKSNRISIESTNFTLSENGEVEANALKITGGSINITSDMESYDVIKLNTSLGYTSMNPYSIDVYYNGLGTATISGGKVKTEHSGETSYLDHNGIHANGLYASTTSGTIKLRNKMELANDIEIGAGQEIVGYGNHVKIGTQNAKLVSIECSLSSVKIGTGTGAIGFFGSVGANKKTVSNLTSPSTATESTIATKLNDLLTALRSYNLIG